MKLLRTVYSNTGQERGFLMENQERYVAYFDMLGFKTATLRNPSKAWGALVAMNDCKENISKLRIGITATKEIVADRVRFFILADSVLFFTLADQDIDLIAILIMASELFSQNLHKCVPLRGGIAHGEFFYNFDKNLFGGVPFVKAHEIGGYAHWSGIVVDEIVATRYQKNPLPKSPYGSIISQWDVPYKDDRTSKSWVIDWPGIFMHNFTKQLPISVEDFYAGFSDLFGSFKDLNVGVKQKYKNTVNFINSFENRHILGTN